MGKQQPPNTKGHQLFLPNDLDQKIKTLAPYGTVDDFIIRCIREGLAPHWKQYISQEYASLQKNQNENRQGPIRRSSPADARKGSAKNGRHKGERTRTTEAQET
jgi:hypothetical protein